MDELQKAVHEIDLRFQSTNSVPVTVARVTAEEWGALKQALAKVLPIQET